METVSGGHCLVAWPSVCRPKPNGGLGIMDLEIMHSALQVSLAWNARMADKAWSPLMTPVDEKIRHLFNAAARVEVGNGEKTFFWTDKWVLGRSVENIAPEDYHAVNTMIRATRTVAEGLPECNWIKDIKKPINIQTFLQAVALWEETRSLHLNPNSEDVWTWTWESNGIYSAKSVYAAHFATNTICEAAKAIWESRAPLKIKFFVWLLFRRRIWTADRLAKRGLPHNSMCVFCNTQNETVKHLFMGCAVINILWCNALEWAGLNNIKPRVSTSLNRW